MVDNSRQSVVVSNTRESEVIVERIQGDSQKSVGVSSSRKSAVVGSQ
jgi:hypothetical protein